MSDYPMSAENPCRPQEGLRGGASGDMPTERDNSHEGIGDRIRERAWYSDQRISITLEQAEPLPEWTVYRPEGAEPGTYSGASGYGVERPTEGEVHHQFNAALRSAARRILGR